MGTRIANRLAGRAGVAAVVLLVGLASRAPAQAVGEVNRIVLRVNEEIATLWDYEKLKQEQLAALAAASLPESRRQAVLARIGEQTMQNLFQELLVLSRAKQIGVVVPEDQIMNAVGRTLENFGVTDPSEYESALAQNGLTMEVFKEQMRRNLAIQEVMGREVQQRVNLVEEDLRRYYRARSEEFREPKKISLREIVVLDSSDLDEAAREQLALDLRDSILSGSVDEELEEHQSSGRSTGWIEHGWVETGDLDPVLAATADTLGVGEVSEPVPARGGLHLLQAAEIQESAILEFNDVRDQIAARERNRLFELEMKEYMEELVDSSHIVSKPPPDAAGFRPVLGESSSASEPGDSALDMAPAATDSVTTQGADSDPSAEAPQAALEPEDEEPAPDLEVGSQDPPPPPG